MAEQQNDVKPGAKAQQLEAQQIISIRGTLKIGDLASAFDERMNDLLDYMRRHGAKPAGPVFVRYHSFPNIGPDDDPGNLEADVEQGVPVSSALPNEGQITAGELPGGPAVIADYVGVPQGLGEPYGQIAAWIKEHNKQPDGPAWEVYYFVDLDKFQGHPGLPDQKTWHHQIVQPVK